MTPPLRGRMAQCFESFIYVGIAWAIVWIMPGPPPEHGSRLMCMTHPVLQRLVEATNEHDLEALTACFAPKFVNETPSHPDRSFVGREQVRQNWSAIFGGVPDIHLAVIRSAVDGESVWAELELKGTRADGVAHWMRGVTIFGIEHDLLAWVRFYVEPVQPDGIPVETVIRQRVLGGQR